MLHVIPVLVRFPVEVAKGTLNNINSLYQTVQSPEKRLHGHIDQCQTSEQKASFFPSTMSNAEKRSHPNLKLHPQEAPAKVRHSGWGKFSHTAFPIRK